MKNKFLICLLVPLIQATELSHNVLASPEDDSALQLFVESTKSIRDLQDDFFSDCKDITPGSIIIYLENLRPHRANTQLAKAALSQVYNNSLNAINSFTQALLPESNINIVDKIDKQFIRTNFNENSDGHNLIKNIKDAFQARQKYITAITAPDVTTDNIYVTAKNAFQNLIDANNCYKVATTLFTKMRNEYPQDQNTLSHVMSSIHPFNTPTFDAPQGLTLDCFTKNYTSLVVKLLDATQRYLQNQSNIKALLTQKARDIWANRLIKDSNGNLYLTIQAYQAIKPSSLNKEQTAALGLISAISIPEMTTTTTVNTIDSSENAVINASADSQNGFLPSSCVLS